MSEIYTPKTQEQIYDALKRYLISVGSSFNNFNTGSRLAVLLEAISLVSSQTQNDVYQGLLKAIPVAIYSGFNFSKKAGIKSTGTLQFARTTNATQDYPIAIGTQIILNGIKFETIEAGSIPLGDTDSGEIAAQCSEKGTDGNINSNAINTLVGQGSFINQPEGTQSCTNPTAFTGGTEEESDADRLQRFMIYINSLARSTVKGILYATRSVEGIKSALVVENYPSDGWITVYADDGTGNLSSALQTEILKVIRGDLTDDENYPGYKAAGIYVQVLPPDVTLVDITGTVYIYDNSELLNTEFKNIATTALQKYTNTLNIGDDWIKSSANAEVRNSHVDIFNFIMSAPASDISIASNRLARTGTINLTISRV
jgi:uncharacterized phage protein gp47/JayE